MSTTLIPSTTEERLSVARSTAPLFFKGASDMTFRERLWLAMLLRYGGVEYNATSFAQTWNLEYSQPEVRQYGDSGEIEFSQHDALQQLTVNVRGYVASDKYSEKQRLMNQGSTQIVNEYKEKSVRLTKRIQQILCAELYTDGYASGNGNRFCGIESFMGDDGNTVAGDLIAAPDDDYGGLATDFSSYGGSWSTTLATAKRPNATLANDFPFGKGDAECDFLVPLLLNTGSTGWASNVSGWKNNCESIMRFSKITQTRRGAMKENPRAPFMHMLASDLYFEAAEYFAAKYRGWIPHKESEDLGFAGDTMMFEGAAIVHEFDCAPGVGYGLTPSMMEMFILTPTLYGFKGPVEAIEKLAYLYLVYVFGNMRFLSPKFFSKYKNYSNS
jgi:hypothetical protein